MSVTKKVVKKVPAKKVVSKKPTPPKKMNAKEQEAFSKRTSDAIQGKTSTTPEVPATVVAQPASVVDRKTKIDTKAKAQPTGSNIKPGPDMSPAQFDVIVGKIAEHLHVHAVGRLIEVPLHGTVLSLLGLPSREMIPTTEERVTIAKRLNEYENVLTKYVPMAAIRRMVDLAVVGPVAKKTAEKLATKDETPASTSSIAKAVGTQTPKAESITDGVPLKKVCAEANIDPKLARRVLRAKGKKPGGRWEWTKAEAPGIVEFLKAAAIAEAKKESGK